MHEEGFPVTEIIADFWASDGARPAFTHENANKLYLTNGRGPKPGDLFRNPDLARSLKRIATAGRDGFYKGPTADAIIAISKETGGPSVSPILPSMSPSGLSRFQLTIADGRVE